MTQTSKTAAADFHFQNLPSWECGQGRVIEYRYKDVGRITRMVGATSKFTLLIWCGMGMGPDCRKKSNIYVGPPHASIADAEAFVRKHADLFAARLDKLEDHCHVRRDQQLKGDAVRNTAHQIMAGREPSVR